MTEKGYKGHAAGSKVEKLHKTFDDKGYDAAVKAGEKLGYTKSGAASWLSTWNKSKSKSKSKSKKATKARKSRKHLRAAA